VPGEPLTFKLFGQTYEVKPPLTSQWKNALALKLTQNIYTGGKITGTLKEAKAEFEAAGCNYELASQNLIFEIKRVYWELVRQELLVRLSEEMVSYHRETLELATFRLSQGTIAPVEVEQAKVDLSNEENRLIQAQTKRCELEDELKCLLDIEPEVEVLVVDEADSGMPLKIDIEKAIEMATDRRIELAELRQRIQAIEGRLVVARSGRYPHLTLVASHHWVGIGKEYPSAWNNFEANYYIGMLG